MIVRRELPSDAGSLDALLSTVPWGAVVVELRTDEAWLPELSFVALGRDGDVVGHVAATRGWVGSDPALALAPPTIPPDRRGEGIGQALMHTLLGGADALGEALVGLVADPVAYYLRFGFRPAEELSIAAPIAEWQPSMVVRPLTAFAPSLRGAFIFPEPFTSR